MAIKFFPSQFPILETKRLILRQPVDDDEDLIFNLYHEPAVVKYIMDPIQTRDQAHAILHSYMDDFFRQERIFWTIVRKDTSVGIGTCCFEQFSSPGLGEIGYDLLPDQQGYGFMREAIKAMLQFGFNVLQLEEIEAFVTPQNLRSIQALQILDFHITGEKEGDYRLSLKRI